MSNKWINQPMKATMWSGSLSVLKVKHNTEEHEEHGMLLGMTQRPAPTEHWHLNYQQIQVTKKGPLPKQIRGLMSLTHQKNWYPN
jgi:hypothetical protein